MFSLLQDKPECFYEALRVKTGHDPYKCTILMYIPGATSGGVVGWWEAKYHRTSVYIHDQQWQCGRSLGASPYPPKNNNNFKCVKIRPNLKISA